MRKFITLVPVALVAFTAIQTEAQNPDCWNCNERVGPGGVEHTVFPDLTIIFGVLSDVGEHDWQPGACQGFGHNHETCFFGGISPADRDALENPEDASVVHLFALLQEYSGSLVLDGEAGTLEGLSCVTGAVLETFALAPAILESLEAMQSLVSLTEQ